MDTSDMLFNEHDDRNGRKPLLESGLWPSGRTKRLTSWRVQIEARWEWHLSCETFVVGQQQGRQWTCRL